MEIKERVIGLLREYIPAIPQDTGLDLFEGKVLDSFAMVNLFVAFEEMFSIRIEPEDISPNSFRSIDAMVEMIGRYTDA